jgi:NitT/TauT family transport system substrate-binding protein
MNNLKWLPFRRCYLDLGMAISVWRLLSHCLMGGAVITAAVGSLGGCFFRPATVDVPVSSWPGYEYIYLAHKLGLDRRAGITIKPLQFPDPQAIVHAYLRGDVSVAQLTTVEAVDLCARAPKRCPVIVLILDESRGGDQIAVANAIPSLQGLKGQPVAVTFSTLGPYVLSRALEQQGLNLTDVQLRNMPLAQMPSALRDGEVKAAVFFPPFSDYAARDGVSRTLFDSRAIPGEVFDVLAVDPAFLKQHRDSVTAVVRAWAAAHEAARKDPDKAIALAAQREQLSIEEYRQAEQGLVYFTLNQQVSMLQPGGLLARNLKAVQAVQARLKLTSPAAPVPAVTSRFAEAAQ